ncbi:MAG: nucleotidyltransferase domain-containing protein [Treponema sp.]|nr:nucleotidyltransferase domain-containing protein [Treponema sp.]
MEQKQYYKKIKDKLEIIKDAILRSVPAEKIYLFGSYAYGKPNKHSDIDIYGVIPNDFDRGVMETMGEIANYLYPLNIINVDLFLVHKNKFLFYIENSSFEETIYNKGILLYENQ